MTAQFRLKSPAPSEQDLLGQIVEFLRWEQCKGRVAWFARCNSGEVKRAGRFIRFYRLYLPLMVPASKGMADIHGMLRGGRYFALEVKKPDEKTTPEQDAFLVQVRAAGGIAAVVRGYAEVPALLFEETPP